MASFSHSHPITILCSQIQFCVHPSSVSPSLCPSSASWRDAQDFLTFCGGPCNVLLCLHAGISSGSQVPPNIFCLWELTVTRIFYFLCALPPLGMIRIYFLYSVFLPECLKTPALFCIVLPSPLSRLFQLLTEPVPLGAPERGISKSCS